MVLLVHHSISPQSRKIRMMMSEKKMLFVLKEEEPWNFSKDIKKLNPAGELPIFILTAILFPPIIPLPNTWKKIIPSRG